MENEKPADGDDHMGAVEADQPVDGTKSQDNAPGLDDQGMPDDPVAICEDVIGANEDGTEG